MKNNVLKGNIMMLSCYFTWGILPLFWALFEISTLELIIQRVLYAAVLMYIIVAVRKLDFKHIFKDKKLTIYLIITSLLLAANWGVYFVGIMIDRIVECSLGYYINPLISILFGSIFLGEKITKLKIVSIVLAFIGVTYLTLAYGQFPFISFGVALTFGAYGIIKKQMNIDTTIGLFMEMLFLFPIAIILQIILLGQGQNVYAGGIDTVLSIGMLTLAGVFTVVPLLLYNRAVKMITLSNVGFLQFLTPTMMFIIGVFVNGEEFTTAHTISFIFIWSAVIVYCIGLIINRNKKQIES